MRSGILGLEKAEGPWENLLYCNEIKCRQTRIKMVEISTIEMFAIL